MNAPTFTRHVRRAAVAIFVAAGMAVAGYVLAADAPNAGNAKDPHAAHALPATDPAAAKATTRSDNPLVPPPDAAEAKKVAVAPGLPRPEPGETLDPQKALKYFKLADGYEINLFASEKDGVMNPTAIAFDTKGRLWVSCTPTYPHALPGVEPNDKLLILEDTNGDGKADKTTVFADHLYLPTGFELGDGGVYVGQQPNLMFLADTDGDDKADVRTIVLHGFGTEDSHHALHAFQWGPGGDLYWGEGTFFHTQVETPYGPVRCQDAAYYRFKPATQKLEVYASYRFANPWGQVFDKWGNHFLADASGGANYYGVPMSGRVEHPYKHPAMKEFTNTKVRPTCGCEVVASDHFPPEAQGNWLLNNVIGFQGIKQYKVEEAGSGFEATEVEPLLFSSDTSFRPVAIRFGPDGALYIADWYNPLVGHMQYSVRDPGRDHTHGRIYRITAKNRPLLDAPKIAGQPVPKLLNLLKDYEDRTRYLVRIELRTHDKQEVAAGVKQWVGLLNGGEPNYQQYLLEALWAYELKEVVDADSVGLLNRCLRSRNPNVRAAATRVVRHWIPKLPGVKADLLALLKRGVNDQHPRVRLEAVVALSDIPTAQAAEVALEALKHPTDYYLDYALKETIRVLEPQWKPVLVAGKPFAADNRAGIQFLLGVLDPDELSQIKNSAVAFQARLLRAGVSRSDREQALKSLAEANKTTALEELLGALVQADRSNSGSSKELAVILGEWPAGDLSKVRAKLQELATTADLSEAVHRGAYAALVNADGNINAAWQSASQSAAGLRDLMAAMPLVKDAKARDALYAKALGLLNGLPEPLASKAAQPQAGVPISGNDVIGRYVRVELPGPNKTLALAEVQAFSGGQNVALSGKATQSSTYGKATADKAIDGNTSGDFKAGGMSHTQVDETSPWWEVDLGDEKPIDSIVVWNRDGDLGARLQGYKLSVFHANRQTAFVKANNVAPIGHQVYVFASDPASAVRRAAVAALPSVPGHDAETFDALAGLIRSGTDTGAAVDALQRVPRENWPKDKVAELARGVVAYATNTPEDQRGTPAFQAVLAFGKELAGGLPSAEAERAKGTLDAMVVHLIVLRPVPYKMAWDATRLTVEAGRPVEVVIDNGDEMPHNFLLLAPGSTEEVGTAAEAMAADPAGYGKEFIPDGAPGGKILHHSKLLQPKEEQRLRFNAPDQPGDYPYICSFPGHYKTMNGVMHVVGKK